MKKSLRNYFKGFTLIELIIVIAIIAVLGVSAFLIITQWISKSRDSRRIADVNVIKKALEIGFARNENSYYPKPDSSTVITAWTDDGPVAWTQGYWGTGVRSQIGDSTIGKIPTDPLTKQYYGYSVTNDQSKYQIVASLDGGESFSSNLNNAYAEDTTQFLLDDKVARLDGNFDNALVTFTGTGEDKIYVIWKLDSIFMASGTVLQTGTIYLLKEGMEMSKAIQIPEENAADISSIFKNCDATADPTACKTLQTTAYTKIADMFGLQSNSGTVNNFLKTVPGTSGQVINSTVTVGGTSDPDPEPTGSCVFGTSKIGSCTLN